MIVKINQNDPFIAKKIHSIFQLSYTVEAKILEAHDFPPLKRKEDDFMQCSNIFFGFQENEEIIGIIEVVKSLQKVHIQSLVVHPKSFRKGVASSLIKFILDKYTQYILTVETGVKNLPAVKLYTKFGFKETRQWETDHNVRKIAFQRH